MWVHGHSGNKENERCDKLATEAANMPNLEKDLRESEFSQIGMDI